MADDLMEHNPVEEIIMGEKDARLTGAASTSAEDLQLRLSSLGNIRIRKMFGGYGVFEEDTMFALVDSAGGIFFKADDTNIPLYDAAGSNKHFRMPYYRVPDKVLADEGALHEWAQSSILVSRNAK
jgi:DNA transformation protein